jgi:hypothetical protein
MTAGSDAKRGGRPFLCLILGAVLLGIAIFVVVDFGMLIDRVVWLNRLMPVTLPLILIAFAVVGIVLWIHGHRVYARNKGLPTVIGLALGFLPLVGLAILMLAPVKVRPQAAEGGESQPSEAENVEEETPTR